MHYGSFYCYTNAASTWMHITRLFPVCVVGENTIKILKYNFLISQWFMPPVVCEGGWGVVCEDPENFYLFVHITLFIFWSQKLSLTHGWNDSPSNVETTNTTCFYLGHTQLVLVFRKLEMDFISLFYVIFWYENPFKLCEYFNFHTTIFTWSEDDLSTKLFFMISLFSGCYWKKGKFILAINTLKHLFIFMLLFASFTIITFFFYFHIS